MMLSGLFTFALVFLAQDEANPAAGAAGNGGSPTPNVPYPIVETLNSTSGQEVNGRALLEGVVAGMGFDHLEKVESIGFDRETWNYRGPKLSFYEKYRVKSSLEGPIRARVEDLTVDPDYGGSQQIAWILNGDDRFKMQRVRVYASAASEKQATTVYHNEMLLLFAPWLALRNASEIEYLGEVHINTYTPQNFDSPDATGNGGYSDYRPSEIDCHKILVTLSGDLGESVGGKIEFWISKEENSELLAFRCELPSRHYVYGHMSPLIGIESFQEVDGLKLPNELYVTIMDNAERIEKTQIQEIKLNAEISPEDLRRP